MRYVIRNAKCIGHPDQRSDTTICLCQRLHYLICKETRHATSEKGFFFHIRSALTKLSTKCLYRAHLITSISSSLFVYRYIIYKFPLLLPISINLISLRHLFGNTFESLELIEGHLRFFRLTEQNIGNTVIGNGSLSRLMNE